MSNWNSDVPKSLLNEAAYRHVPVETGGQITDSSKCASDFADSGVYTNEGSASKMTRLIDFLAKDYIDCLDISNHEEKINSENSPKFPKYQKILRYKKHGRSEARPTKRIPPPYLAQYPIFDYIPSLLPEIIPVLTISNLSHCDTVHVPQRIEPQTINIWIGPNQTVSPLHMDQRDNLLCQVSVRNQFSSDLHETNAGGRSEIHTALSP